ncbi:protein kinase domain-containing protein [Candidatus Arthromitus sp. SFB-rat-Yit]|uniref:protein kinase domain-containing protein n=1 Tax=Candidatus Arthromitus sp. SFB-rat-Yit TaxID=1041504 RepID=UPI000227A652|nr:protein kinase [Candidatus Arthromitus sp. SFB-rat-Yit]BAK81065.1 protein kinase [Candidatus Arthromitus sp. SFB-rat-Yit]
MIGKVIGGRYEIIEKLGEGGMANVYKAKCRILKRFITIKILKQELINDEEFVRKFKDEAMEVAKLSDNNIVKVYDIGVEDNFHYIVMEYIDGKTLKEHISEKGVLSIKEALDFSIQICNGLVIAHDIELIHRDIKSQNILVSNYGNIKVTDFGIAKSSDSATITNSGKILGSAYYISPEQARGNFVDCRSDIYSFGVVMYEMFTGRLPFTHGTPVNVALQHIQVDPIEPMDIVKKLPIGINNLIIKCLQKNPALRYQSAKELRDDLKALQNNKKHFVTRCNMVDKTTVMSAVTPQIQNKTNDSKIFKNLVIVLCSILAFIILILIFNRGLLGKPSSNITVPSFLGKTGVQYEQELEKLGLNYKISGYVTSDLEKNFVVDTYPKEGTVVRKGDTVKAILSEGVELIKVPNVINMTIERARLILQREGLIIGNIEERFSDVYERGVIMIQNPSPGSQINKNETVSIVISRGSETSLVTVPQFVGKDIVEAQNLAVLSGINIKLKSIDTEVQDNDKKIFYQSVPDGIEIKPTVEIELSYYNYVKKQVLDDANTSDKDTNINENNNIKDDPINDTDDNKNNTEENNVNNSSTNKLNTEGSNVDKKDDIIDENMSKEDNVNQTEGNDIVNSTIEVD